MVSFIQTEDGRAFPYSTDRNNYYEYYLQDHLGNNRIAFDNPGGNGATVEQQDDYLPFGFDISGTVNTPKNEYLYNKKELQSEFAEYDYGARFYDPVIARWTTIDPMAEVSRRWSNYNYVMDNPIRLIDPDGMFARIPNGSGMGEVDEDGSGEERNKPIHHHGRVGHYFAGSASGSDSGSTPPDWVMDNKTHEVHDDPKVHKASDVNQGETYIGKTGSYIATSGAEINLKADGSWVAASMDNGSDPNDVFHGLGIGKGWDQLADILEFTTGLLGGGIGGLEEAGATLLEDSGTEQE